MASSLPAASPPLMLPSWISKHLQAPTLFYSQTEVSCFTVCSGVCERGRVKWAPFGSALRLLRLLFDIPRLAGSKIGPNKTQLDSNLTKQMKKEAKLSWLILTRLALTGDYFYFPIVCEWTRMRPDQMRPDESVFQTNNTINMTSLMSIYFFFLAPSILLTPQLVTKHLVNHSSGNSLLCSCLCINF